MNGSTPRPPHRPIGGQAPYALAGTMMRVVAAELTDSGRFMRARRLQEERSIATIDVTAGVLSGSVQGSDPQPYDVRWDCLRLTSHAEQRRRALALDHPNRATQLVPGAADLRATCTCVDATSLGSGVCKHAIAVLLEFADDIAVDATRLADWRGVALGATEAIDPDDPGFEHADPEAASQPTAMPSAPGSTTRTAATVTTFVDPLGDLLDFPSGTRLLAGRHRITPLDPPTVIGDDDVLSEVLADALDWMQNASPW